jgi:NDP-4-keto-2,6-dideoxyhexose 3-C-methyltransferase
VVNCKNCGYLKLKKVFKIGKQPISSVFYNKPKANLKKYSLDLFKCPKCDLVQFSSLPPLEDMYGLTYGYNTSLSPLMVNHMKKKFDFLRLNYKKLLKGQILDIGSNDGTFLNFLKSLKTIKLYGIDPSAKKFLNNYKKNIFVIPDFFSKEKLLGNLSSLQVRQKFNIITSFAMFYDIEDPNKFCKDIYELLNDDGIWMVEFSYLPLLFKNLTYDQICHEHVTYYSLTTFNKILKNNNMKVIDLSFNEINGGSIEVICVKKKLKIRPKKIVEEVLEQEAGINENIFNFFQDRVENVKKTLLEFLKNIPAKDIIGYGASTKGNIVLNHLKLTNKNLSFICDANPFKLNRYTPGSNIKIISKKEMRKSNPKYLLVLIWSFRSEVIRQEINYIKKGGKLVFHLPIFHIIDKNNYKKYLKSNFNSMSYSIN